MRLSLRQLLASAIGKEQGTQNSVLRILPTPAEECDDRKEKTINVLDESGLIKSLFHQIDNCTWGIRVDEEFFKDLIEQLDTNFSNTNLVFDGDRIHDLNENSLRLGNGHFQIDNQGNTYRWQIETNISGGLLFKVTEVSSGREVGFEVRPGAFGIRLHTGQNTPTFGEYYVKLVPGANILEYSVLKINEYSNHAHANSSAQPGELYRTSGVNQVFVKDGGTIPKTLYSGNDSLTGNRNVDVDSYTLEFSSFKSSAQINLHTDNFLSGEFEQLFLERGEARFRIRYSGNDYGVILNSNGLQLKTGQDLSFLVGQALVLQDTDGKVEFKPITIPEYADDNAADADSNLLTGQMYTTTGDRTVKRKP